MNLHYCGCWNCEYGDYDKQLKENVCCHLSDGDLLSLTDDMRQFIEIMGCGSWHWVIEGNPRIYPPSCIECKGYNSLRIPPECEFKGHHVSEKQCVKGCNEFEQRDTCYD